LGKVETKFASSATDLCRRSGVDTVVKRNVLHLRDSNGIYGAERVVLTIGKNIDRSKFKFILLCMRRKDGRSEELISAAKKFKLKVLTVNVDKRLDVTGIIKIRKLLKDNKIDIIHTHDFKSDFYALFASLFFGNRRITTVHGSTRDSIKIRLYLYLSEKILYRTYHGIVAVSVRLVKWLKNRGVREGKLHVIQNGIDTDIIREMSGKNTMLSLENTDDEKFFAIIGRLFPDKGHFHFLEALKYVVEKKEGVKGIIVGEGPYKKEIEEKIKRLGIQDHVHFLGFQKNMLKIYQFADYLVIASLREGLPYVLLEAMTFKIPVLATAVGDIPMLIKNNQTGLLVPPGNTLALQNGMLKMLQKPGHYQQLAENAYTYVNERFSAERMIQKTEALYEEIMA
jgi:glycosyltransferase involved in cell wall biosynthesis